MQEDSFYVYAYKTLVRKTEGKMPLGRPRCRWEDNVKLDLTEIWFGVDSSGSGYGPVADSCEHGNEPFGSTEGGEFLEKLSTYQLLKEDSAPLS
jgi:hypothetical protein